MYSQTKVHINGKFVHINGKFVHMEREICTHGTGNLHTLTGNLYTPNRVSPLWRSKKRRERFIKVKGNKGEQDSPARKILFPTAPSAEQILIKSCEALNKKLDM